MTKKQIQAIFDSMHEKGVLNDNHQSLLTYLNNQSDLRIGFLKLRPRGEEMEIYNILVKDEKGYTIFKKTVKFDKEEEIL